MTFLSYKIFTALIYCILALLIFGLLYHNVKPETYDMELFSVSDKTIRSPKTVEDEVKTAEERENVSEEVGKVYVFKKEMAQNRISLLTSIFDFVKETKQEIKLPEKLDESETQKEVQSKYSGIHGFCAIKAQRVEK